MDFNLSQADVEWRDRVRSFMDSEVRPRAADYDRQQREGERWKVLPVVEELKQAREGSRAVESVHAAGARRGHVDDSFAFDGPGLTNLQYALCAEEMGRVLGVGGVQLLGARHRQHGSAAALRHPRAKGAVAEAADGRGDPLRLPDDRAGCRVVRRDEHRMPDRDATATNMSINGRKWWSSGAGDPRCKVAIVMGKTDPTAPTHSSSR